MSLARGFPDRVVQHRRVDWEAAVWARSIAPATRELDRDVAIKVLPERVQGSGTPGALRARSAGTGVVERSKHRQSTDSRNPAACTPRHGARRGPTTRRADALGAMPSTKHCRSPGRSPRRSRRRTSKASFIAISNRQTSRSRRRHVKVLDFGFAKALRPASSGSGSRLANADVAGMTQYRRDARDGGLHVAGAGEGKPSTVAPISGRSASC